MSDESKAPTVESGPAINVAKHLGQLVGLIGKDGKPAPDWEDWFSNPGTHFADIPNNDVQRDAIVEILKDVWPKKRVLKNHPLLDDKGNPEAGMQWLEVPGRKAEDPKDGYPTAVYVVTDKLGEADDPEKKYKSKKELAAGVGLTYRYKPKDPSLKDAAKRATIKAIKSGSVKGAKTELSAEAKNTAYQWISSQFVFQPFIYFPLVGLPEQDEGYFALGTVETPLRFGFDIHFKSGSKLEKLSWNGIRLISSFTFRPDAKPPTFQLFGLNKSGEYQLLDAPDLRKILNAFLEIPDFRIWLAVYLPQFPGLDIFAWLEGLNFEFPEFEFPTLCVEFDKWLLELAEWLEHFVPNFKFPHLDLAWLLTALLSLKLPPFKLPGLPHLNFSLDFHEKIGFSFQVNDTVLSGKSKDAKRKISLQLGETFGLEGEKSWLGKDITPGVTVVIGEIGPRAPKNGEIDLKAIRFEAKPTLELASLGLDIEGGKNKPLFSAKGATVAAIEPRFHLLLDMDKHGKFGVHKWGVATKLKKIGVPLGGALKSGDDNNQVAKSLLAGGGDDKAKGKADSVNPEFGMSVSYLRDERSTHADLAVHLYDDKDKPAEVIMMPFQRAFGPLHLRKVGFGWENEHRMLSLLIDGEVKIKALSIDLEHLSIGIPITHPTKTSKYELGLDGIGIQYNGGPVEISGAFIERKLPENSIEYAGAATVKAETFALGALGSYAFMKNPAPQTGGYASMFAFVLIETTIGGPPCFFVEGLAGGFGYNRRFVPPKVTDIEHFPLVRALSDPAAIGGTDAGPAEALEILDPYVSPERGEYWFAAGVKFTSFELVDTSALLVAEFGNELVITLLGLSTLKLPKEGSPIANVELALEVVIKPDDGTLLAKAILTDNSWVIDKACKLTGGFAFALWFGENTAKAPVGDFVLTLGGYHPHFKPPAHYPKVPRLAFNWPVSGEVTIKGNAYFALTPSQIMAGGGLEVLFHSGDLRAWFRAQMDVLIGWEPFHYDAEIKVTIGASYKLHLLFVTVNVSIELGADLVIWGPPMGGEAHIHWFIIGFTVGFGAKKLTSIPAISWAEFEKKLMPKPNSPTPIVRIQPVDGVHEQVPVKNAKNNSKDTPAQRWIVRPDHFVFSTTSTVPATHVVLDIGKEKPHPVGEPGETVSIRPMQLEKVSSIQTISISSTELHDEKLNLVEKWDYDLQTRSLPQALWAEGAASTKKPAGNDGKLLVDGLRTGLGKAHPKHPTIDGPPPFNMKSVFVPLPLVAGEDSQHLALDAAELAAGTAPKRPEGVLNKIHSTILAKQREREKLFAALQDMGIDPGTNDVPTGIARDPKHVFEASPMLGSAS